MTFPKLLETYLIIYLLIHQDIASLLHMQAYWVDSLTSLAYDLAMTPVT